MNREEMQQQRLNEIRAQSGQDPWKLLAEAKSEIKLLEAENLEYKRFYESTNKSYELFKKDLRKENAELRECQKFAQERRIDIIALQSKLDVALNFIDHAKMFSQCLATRDMATEALAKIQEGK